MRTHTSSVFSFSARPNISSTLIIRRPSLIYYHHHHHHSRCSQSYLQHSYFHPNDLSYRSHRVRSYSGCSNVNSSNMSLGRSNYRDQGVHGGSQPEPSNRQPTVGIEREEQSGGDVERADDFSRGKRGGSPVYDLYSDFFGKEKETFLPTYSSWDAGSQALKASTSSSASTSNSKSSSEGFMSPYGVYDMDDSSFFAHTTRLNITGPNPNSTQFLRPRSSSTERLLINRGERLKATPASSLHKTDRSCSPSPPEPPPVPEKRTSPTDSYLQISLQPSLPLVDPTASRKLLVLDLNGTLLLRGAYTGRRSTTSLYPNLRTIYRRPYLPSFRAYIFHPITLQWLDTMVWSSAQSHSVNDMVEKCFGTGKKLLKAVWARDTLGLSNNEYFKKTQTIKDLDKPWAQIPSLVSTNLSPTEESPPDRPENPNPEVVTDRGDVHPSVPQQQQHSALTTVLMDDSPLKAILQPWNHLCVSEYGSERRRLDVQLVERELEGTWLAEWEKQGDLMGERECALMDEREQECTWLDEQAMESSEESTEVKESKEAEPKRTKEEKGMGNLEKLILASEQQEIEEKRKRRAVKKMGKKKKGYDELLLAVIGILDALKHEGNVAGWMRSGGLVHVDGDHQKRISETPETETTTTTSTIATTLTTSTLPLTPRSKRDSPTTPIQGPSKRRRLTHDTELEPSSAYGERLDPDSGMVVLPTTLTTMTTSLSISVPSSPSHPSPPRSSSSSSPSSSSPLLSAQVEQALTGVPLSTTADEAAAAAASSSTTPTPTTTTIGNKISVSTRRPAATTTAPPPFPQLVETQPLWCEIPCVLSHWAERGRKALAELGIEVIHGVVSPDQSGNQKGNWDTFEKWMKEKKLGGFS